MEPVSFIDYEVDGIDHNDYPDYCDAYISSATAVMPNNVTRDATEEELDKLNEDAELIHNLVYELLF